VPPLPCDPPLARDRVSLSGPELSVFATGLAGEPDRWAHLLDDLDGTRAYELIWDDSDVNAWAIRWSEDADTGFHDHDESAAAIAVIRGRVREDRLALGGPAHSREFTAGETFVVEPVAIHRILHAGDGPAVTIHAYSPPLRRTGAYRVGPDGELERESQPFEVELGAHEPALM
jgi:mannose-6-phosphate isomerase-like protein (cupin superfamily)